MLRGQANHIESFFLSHLFGKPKDTEQAAERPPIVFISAFGPPGSYYPWPAGSPSRRGM